MLCFHGPMFEEHRDSLQQLTEQGLLTKDNFKGGYSLTKVGFAALHRTHDDGDGDGDLWEAKPK